MSAPDIGCRSRNTLATVRGSANKRGRKALLPTITLEWGPDSDAKEEEPPIGQQVSEWENQDITR
jgi:hypothetical protein